MPPEEPTHAGPPGSIPGPPDPSAKERDLIAEAIRQASPRGSSAPSTAGPPIENLFAGYEILREIHRGGQGVVYQALQKATKRKVAIKVLHGGPFTGSTGRSRFEREVQILGQLSHPNIVRLHDSGVTADGSFYYVMDYISGRPLDELVADRKLGVEDTLRLFLKICDGVNAAHLKGVIHRDLKPGNVRIDANAEPIVVDFGLAKVALPDVIDEGDSPQIMTLTGQFIGSLPWASPEQAEGRPGNIDVRTDVYSLGVMLYQMLTGQFPYKVIGNMRDVLDNILKAEPAKPSTVRRQINDEVETIVLKCLSKERDRRYQSAGELARDIRHYLAGEPVEAKRDSGLYVLGKTLHRYKGPVAAAGVLLVLIVCFGVAMAVMYRVTDNARDRAQEALAALRIANLAEVTARERAERNFKAGHALAMTMMTRIDPEIADLRGATRARELLLSQAQTYLASLRTEAGDDPGLLLDLAAAHERIGDLMGELYMRRLGDTAGAESHFTESRKIRADLLTRLPDDPRVLAANARSKYREAGLLVLKGGFQQARAAFAEAVGLYDRALAAPSPGSAEEISRWRDGRAWTLRAYADVLFRMSEEAGIDAAGAKELLRDAESRLAEAERVWRAVLSADRANAGAARAIGVVADQRAAVHVLAGKGLAASAAKLRDGGRPDDAAEQWRAALARFDRAAEISAAAAAEFERLASADQTNAQLRRDQWLAYYSIGVAFSEKAEVLKILGAPEGPSRDAAMQNFRNAESIARRLADVDSASLESVRDLAVCLNRIGNELRAARRWEEADRAYGESMTLRERLVDADPMQRHQRDLGVGYFKLGQLRAEWARDGAPAERSARLETARTFLERAMAQFVALKDQGVLAADSAYIKETRQALDDLGKP